MAVLTIETITREALKILDRSYGDAYIKHNRRLFGGNDAIHAASKGHTEASGETLPRLHQPDKIGAN